MAAQANLTEMKDDSELETAVKATGFTDNKAKINLLSDGNTYEVTEYIYATPSGQGALYDVIIPVGSVDSAIRDEHVVIEFNPDTGNVYAVFYWEEDGNQSEYSYDKIIKLRDDEDARKKLMLGYYCGSEIYSSTLDSYSISAKLAFENAHEGLVLVDVQTISGMDITRFMDGLEASMTIMGETGGKVEKKIKIKGETDSKF